MSHADAALLEAVPLSTPCWWIDRGDCWESTCHPTREAAEADHVARVRLSNGEDISVAHAFSIVPGTARQGRRCCWEITCPECGTPQHNQDRVELCIECDCEIVIEQIAPDDPGQGRLFEALPTHDIPGQPLGRVAMFAEDEPR